MSTTNVQRSGITLCASLHSPWLHSFLPVPIKPILSESVIAEPGCCSAPCIWRCRLRSGHTPRPAVGGDIQYHQPFFVYGGFDISCSPHNGEFEWAGTLQYGLIFFPCPTPLPRRKPGKSGCKPVCSAQLQEYLQQADYACSGVISFPKP